jgi:hypothetical protein
MSSARAFLFLAGFSIVGVGCTAASTSEPTAPADFDEPETAEDVGELNSGRVALRVPLLDENGKLLSRHNAEMRAAGLATFPDTVEIRGGADGAVVRDGAKKWEKASALIDAAYEKGIELTHRLLAEPADYETKDAATTICYTGSAKLVASLIQSLTDSVFSDQLGIHGWRYRQTKELQEGSDPEWENAFPSIWKNWRGRGNAILFLTASSDSGDELNVGIVRKCQ